MRPIEEVKQEVFDILKTIAYIDELRELLNDENFRNDYELAEPEASVAINRVLAKFRYCLVNG